MAILWSYIIAKFLFLVEFYEPFPPLNVLSHTFFVLYLYLFSNFFVLIAKILLESLYMHFFSTLILFLQSSLQKYVIVSGCKLFLCPHLRMTIDHEVTIEAAKAILFALLHYGFPVTQKTFYDPGSIKVLLFFKTSKFWIPLSIPYEVS